jgi:replication initiation and membrane attachment protein DnaB
VCMRVFFFFFFSEGTLFDPMRKAAPHCSEEKNKRKEKLPHWSKKKEKKKKKAAPLTKFDNK